MSAPTETALFARMHGATTHFPLALLACASAFELAGFLLRGRAVARDLQVAGTWTVFLAALGAVPAVASGLVMTHGEVLGHGLLRMHHLFVWPAFALSIALATWRVCIGRNATRRMLASYLAVLVIAAVAAGAGGYFGGEMLLGGGGLR